MHADGAYNKDDCPVLAANTTADVAKKFADRNSRAR